MYAAFRTHYTGINLDKDGFKELLVISRREHHQVQKLRSPVVTASANTLLFWD
jgi:hypothetical protein